MPAVRKVVLSLKFDFKTKKKHQISTERKNIEKINGRRSIISVETDKVIKVAML